MREKYPRRDFNYFGNGKRSVFSTSMALLLLGLILMGESRGFHLKDSEEEEIVWERKGDMQLGVVLSLTAFHKDQICGPRLRAPSALHRLHAITFALDEINRRDDILPNVTLGFVVMDDCSRDASALLRALHFVPRPGCEDRVYGLSTDVMSGVGGSGGVGGRIGDITDVGLHTAYIQPIVKTYSVVGVLGAELSESSMQMAALLSVFRVPQLSYASSSPFLSDKNKFRYFSRIVPSDRQQAKVIVDILQHFQWTYVAVVYSYGVYGLSGFRYIRGALERKGFCLAASIATESEFNEDDYDNMVEDLLSITPKVKVVVLFTLHAGRLLRAAKQKGLGGRFVWLSSDTLVPNVKDFKDYEDFAVGLLLVGFKSAPVQRFEEQFQYSTLSNSSDNPWFVRFFERMFNCSTNISLPLHRCNPNLPIRNSPLYENNTSVMRAVNSVYTFARALHNVTRGCPYTPRNVTDCFTPKELLDSLRSTNFIGENGVRVGIDSTGNGIATYEIRNLRADNGRYSFALVGEWDGGTQNFSFLDTKSIMWHPYSNRFREKYLQANENSSKDDHGAENDDQDDQECRSDEDCVPTSTCREQCSVGYHAVPTWPRCCWVCKQCRENEYTYIRDGLPACHACPSDGNFSWPDSDTRSRCLPIHVTFVTFDSPLGSALLTLDFLVLTLVVTCSVLYIRSRTNRLIKATSRELSAVMLLGHLLACLAVPVLLAEPSSASCLVAHTAFHVSLTLVYAPLLVKINRIYRIFVSGKKSAQKPRLIGSGFQLLISIGVVVIHLLFIAIWMIIYPPSHVTRMPNVNEKHVELICVVSKRGFSASLCINLVLMAACAVHSLSTRRLPANFNEAKFILICVYTIVVLWLSFLATYFVMDNGVVHTLCLALALLVNVISCQVFLFVPKLYAVYKVPSAQLHVVNDTPDTNRKRNQCITESTIN